MWTTGNTNRMAMSPSDDDDDDDDDEDEGESEEGDSDARSDGRGSVDGIYLGKKPLDPKPGEIPANIPDEQARRDKDPFDITDGSEDDDAAMEEIRRKVLASKTFSNPNPELEQEKKKPASIPRPQQRHRYQVDLDMQPDSDNERSGDNQDSDAAGDDDEFDNIIEATPVTDRIGLAKLEKERRQATTTTKTFSSTSVSAPNRW